MIKYVFRRLILFIPVLFIVTILISSLIYFSPGDPVRVMLGFRANEAAVAQIRAELGLDRPYHIRYLMWLGNAVRGNLGRSLQRNEDVLDMILERLPATLELMVFAVIVAVLLAIPIGVISATRANTLIDNSLSFFSLFWVSMPGFWIAMISVLIFSVILSIFPISGRGGALWSLEGLRHLALPGLILGVRQVAIISRLIRAGMLEILEFFCVITAPWTSAGRPSSSLPVCRRRRTVRIPWVLISA